MKKYQISNIKYQIDKLNIKNIFNILYACPVNFVRNFFGVFFIFYILFFIFFAKAKEARAQSLALSVSPPLLEVMIKPGKSITQVYKLTNNGEPTVVTVKLLELTPNGITENEDFVPDKWISIISNDIKFDKPFLLAKEKTAEFLLKVSPTDETEQKDYYRALVVTTTPQPQDDTTMTSFVENLASPILITVTSSGVLNKAAQIIKFDVPSFIDSFAGLSVDIEVKNTGKAYFHTQGKITLTGPVGRASFDLIPYAVLTEQTKRLITTNTKTGKSIFLPGFYIGKYTLSLDLALDETSNKINQTKTFYAVPWKSAIILILFILLGIKLLKSPRLFKKDNR